MWQLSIKGPLKEWMVDGHYPDLTTVTRRILELDGAADNGIFYRLHILGSLPTPDDEALGELEYDGRKALYYVKRRRH